MSGKIKPPITGFREVVLYRGAYSEQVVIFIGSATYRLHFMEASRWFRNLCQEEYILDRVFSYLWNMRCLKYFVDYKRFIPFQVNTELLGGS